jgi:hypothetical protein
MQCFGHRVSVLGKEKVFRQDAETDTLQACAPRLKSKSGRERPLSKLDWEKKSADLGPQETATVFHANPSTPE